jgi:UDP-3-O-[3-hydroxymyristoyl] N-acetylglucosamine deacetylase
MSKRNAGSGGRFLYQKTLKNSIHCSGVGLHCGAKIGMTLHPAAPNTGIVFRRTDRRGGVCEVAATWRNAVETPLCTTLVGQDANGRDVKFATVEHLLSALLGCGIDNAVIEMNGPEVPAMDGSAAPFVFLIECAGTVEQDAPRRGVEILKEISVSDTDRSAALLPGRGLSVDFEIDFDSPVVAHQACAMEVTEGSYKRDIARARTFGFLHEVDHMRAMGLALGGSLDNAIVISGDRVLNPGGLRYEDEFVRHKVLDLIGDLYLAGGPVIGLARGIRAGHALTLRLLQTLFADAEAWTWRDMTPDDAAVRAGAAVPPARAVAAPA